MAKNTMEISPMEYGDEYPPSRIEEYGSDSDSDSDTESETFHSHSTACSGKTHNQMQTFASKETKQIRLCRALVVLSIFALGTFVVTFQHRSTSLEQEEANKHAFTAFAKSIEHSFKDNVRSLFDANRALAQAITTASMTYNQTFPYVTVPAFEVYGHEARTRGRIESLVYAPIADELYEWIKFSVEHASWIDESKIIYDRLEPGFDRSLEKPLDLEPLVWGYGDDGVLKPWKKDNETFMPSMYISPPPFESAAVVSRNINLFTDEDCKIVSFASAMLKDAAFSKFKSKVGQFRDSSLGVPGHSQHFLNQINDVDNNSLANENIRDLQPHSIVAQPVFKQLGDISFKTDVAGYIFSVIAWDVYLTDLLPAGVSGIVVVLSNTCEQRITYELVGHEVLYVGEGDLHDPAYDDQKRTVTLSEYYFDPTSAIAVDGYCQIYLDIYPSPEFEKAYEFGVTVSGIAIIFFLVAVLFMVYDRFVHLLNSKVINQAARFNEIISSLFPQVVHDRLIAENGKDQVAQKPPRRVTSTSHLRGFLQDNASAPISGPQHSQHDKVSTKRCTDNAEMFGTKPIADLFPETTILFADIVGFTAWSSVKEPAQVFTLLENVYLAFDEIARRRSIFKVETIGDCYVAVCGLPDPCQDHAVKMCRFAGACMKKMREVTAKLEVKLGPATGDLSMRMGLHSGPVTAGVLRGERSRFQLFGDTMNTASRMESTGEAGCIQLSADTADLLMAVGKGHWLKPRADKVDVKGKGAMQTFFLNSFGLSAPNDSLRDQKSLVTLHTVDEHEGTSTSNDKDDAQTVDSSFFPKEMVGLGMKNFKLVRWNVEVLTSLLKQIVGRRRAKRRGSIAIVSNIKEKQNGHNPSALDGELSMTFSHLIDEESESERNTTVLEEVAEIVTLPKFDAKAAGRQEPTNSIKLPDEVTKQLQEFVSTISFMYNDNPFHNFEHASHVTTSVVKLLSRIIAPSDLYLSEDADDAALHDHTYGITSDPLTQFSCVLSALIHDLDHPGVPNAQLVEEQTDLAIMYKGKSVAEQNSVDISWNLLMEDRYSALRRTICEDETEMKRFRQLVVNSVMATDIVDKELKALRNARWEKAFSTKSGSEECLQVAINRKATIVIEHLIQASDVVHTMQHWHIYRKWNELFFEECYKSYKMGRAASDPSENWYKGELGFFDFYIIPLAKKLKDCGVFGVSSHEYLNYALQNRKEWEDRGQDIVQQMIANVKGKVKDWEAEAEMEGFTPNTEEAHESPVERAKRTILRMMSRKNSLSLVPARSVTA